MSSQRRFDVLVTALTGVALPVPVFSKTAGFRHDANPDGLKAIKDAAAFTDADLKRSSGIEVVGHDDASGGKRVGHIESGDWIQKDGSGGLFDVDTITSEENR